MRMHVDTPRREATVIAPFVVEGWALDLSASVGTGVDWVDVWAIPATGAPVYLGPASIGHSRPDVAAVYGPGFTPSGFRLTVNATLRPDDYTLHAFARRIATGNFDVVDRVPINVRGTTLTDLAPCTAGQVPRFNGSTWDCADIPGANGGNGNVAVGRDFGAGSSLASGNDNIYINNTGGHESGTIRIGTDPTQTRAFFAGIFGIPTDVGSAIPVLIGPDGQLGTVSSSRRYKHDIENLGDYTAKLYDLRPVSFKYLASLDSSQTRTYGLIAEEVAAVMPDLVAHDKSGNIETVKYQLLAPLLLNEVQRLKRELDASAVREAELAKALAALNARLDALEKRVP